jgi:hypothetical protein
MRSTWSAERVIALLAGASLEGAWLTLLYLAFQWLTANHVVHLGIGSFAASAVVGALLARRIRHWPRQAYTLSVIAAAILAGVVGAWLAVAPHVAPGEVAIALVRHPGGWLLGLGILRGTAHGDWADETSVAELVLDRGMVGLVAFWVLATMSGMVHAAAFESAGFAATLTFVSAGLLALGLARLTDLDVQAMDPGRTRWLLLLLGVSVLVLVVGIPLAAVLGLPLGAALAGIVGPLGPLVVALIAILAVPAGLLLGWLAALFPRWNGQPEPIPSIGQPFASAAGQQVLPPGAAPDLTWLLWLAAAVGAALALAAMVALVRRPDIQEASRSTDEVREAEPFEVGLRLRLPRLRVPHLWRRPPADAIEAYRLALDSLVGRDEARHPGETPREHAERVREFWIGVSLGRLAVDYQLGAFAGRPLTDAEERRALARWRRISRRSRT